MGARYYSALVVVLAFACCTPPSAPTPARRAPRRARSSPSITSAEDGGAAVLSFWLLTDHGPWRSTLYAIDAEGQLREEETVGVGSALTNEPAGTLRWIGHCDGSYGCQVRKSCPLGGRVLESLGDGLADSCEPLRLTVVSACSDAVERQIKVGFDGRCDPGHAPNAFLFVEGEPVFDGQNPGWERITRAVYLPCGNVEACRARVAQLEL